MAAPRRSPFADQPFDVAASNTESLVEEWLKQRKIPGEHKPDVSKIEHKPWYRGAISGVPLPTLIRRLGATINNGLRDNRYRLPWWYYITCFTALYIGGVGQPLIAIPEGLEMLADYRHNHPLTFYGYPTPQGYEGPGDCGRRLQALDRFWRVLFRSYIMSLPLIVSMSIFFFPALVQQ